MTDTSRKRVEDLAAFHEVSATLYDITEESGLKAMHATAAATLRALLDRAERAEAGLCGPGQHPKQLCAQASEMMRQRDAARAAMAYDEHHPGYIAGVKAGKYASESKIAAAVAAERDACAEFIATHIYRTSNAGPAVVPSPFAANDQHHRTLAAAIRARGTT